MTLKKKSKNKLFCLSADALVSTGLAKLGYNYVNIGKPLCSNVTFIKKKIILKYSNPSLIFFKLQKHMTWKLINWLSDDCWAELQRDSKVRFFTLSIYVLKPFQETVSFANSCLWFSFSFLFVISGCSSA